MVMTVLSSNSLFSTIITLYILIFLYFPSLLHFFFSPVAISTIFLLLYILKLGAQQNSTIDSYSNSNCTQSPISKQIEDFHDRDLQHGTDTELQSSCKPEQIEDFHDRDHDYVTELKLSCEPGLKQSTTPFYAYSFVEWDVRAPLEVIYEEHEGEKFEANDGVSEANRESQINAIQRYATLSLFYPESDGEYSSEGDSPTNGDWYSQENNMCFRWEEEDDRDGLIEIELDEKRNSEADEDNLIEIDLFPAR